LLVSKDKKTKAENISHEYIGYRVEGRFPALFSPKNSPNLLKMME
jgi:hypothetical protein